MVSDWEAEKDAGSLRFLLCGFASDELYRALGMGAVLMLVPLAATSTDAMVKRLGGRRWRRLHILVYPAGVLGVIHFFMMIKADFTEPTIYAVVLALLFAVRLYKKWA
jgi:sulfoxide reductase heme-binding subunit YedZ